MGSKVVSSVIDVVVSLFVASGWVVDILLLLSFVGELLGCIFGVNIVVASWVAAEVDIIL